MEKEEVERQKNQGQRELPESLQSSQQVKTEPGAHQTPTEEHSVRGPLARSANRILSRMERHATFIARLFTGERRST